MAGGLSLAWLHKVLGADGKTGLGFEDMVALGEAVPAGARGVTFVPFLEGAATPYGAPLARAGFHGLSSAHGAGEMVQAAMEGVAFNIRQCVDLFRKLGGTISEVRIAEGGARVPRWCQIVADVLACPVRRIEELDASAVGAALMAQVGVGGGTLQAVIDRSVRLGGEFRPSPETARAYETAYRRYLSLADAEAAGSRRSPAES
jgi:xylulokinase